MIGWFGLKGTQLIYAGLLLAGAVVCVGEMTLSLAIFARFVENETFFRMILTAVVAAAVSSG